MATPINVYSEIGTLKTVMLKRPGRELENLTPEYLERLLFDDIPFLPAVQKEHDEFAKALENEGIEVLYLEQLTTEALHDASIREQFINELLSESKADLNGAYQRLKDYLLSFDTESMVDRVMSGIRKNELEQGPRSHLHELMEDHYPFYLDPMPNLYFTRDPAAAIGHGLSINKMKEPARRRESLFMQYIIKHHPRFKGHDIPVWLDRDFRFNIEGGDELVLSRDTIAIGVSERTSAQAIERLARNLFKRQDQIKRVLAVEIPKSRAFMHLDTVFTMVDHDQFTIHPAIQGPDGDMRIFVLERGKTDDDIQITEENNLPAVLKKTLGLSDVNLILCGGGDEIASAREQWNDGSNTLAIAPGVVVTYDRNYISNECLRKQGIKVIEIPSGELSRGRGGPRCMSMPIYREDLR
ncbi:arginine deiminase [Bacillus sp. CLL-7-23]|uniref:Arginine deiminase n=1 Tax=Bacillus changyiensis TaxID=3004103 RepID=A0ABT4WYV9_9BACI|nr:arginine deiminase [Bacillus changyiensis]MDA7025217.1 arginine deiminase [Bacillus changyiensis]